MTQPQTSPWPRLPLWLAAAAALAFLVLGALLFGRDWRRERDYLGELYLWRGEALINSLEALGRARPAEPWAEGRLQRFWDSLEDEDQVLFIVLTDGRGQILASAGRLAPPPELFRAPLPAGPGTADFFQPQRLVEVLNGRRVELIRRVFRPSAFRRMKLMGPRGHHREADGHAEAMFPAPALLEQAWVGFDLTALDRLGAGRARSAAVSIGLFCLAGLATMLALFAGHNTRLARRMYQEVKAELTQKERLAALGHLAAGLAHEIRNPLGAISGLCRHLLDKSPAAARDREALEVML
ncbi:MAG: hypothetical protein LBV21_05270, partial [Candidatus Adiutrix sp.]|nr:hypothetical protein [Candidatus Adiutrix sp.]